MRYPNIKNFKYITKVYGFNLSDVDISGVSFSDCDLRPIKVRKDRNLFQKIQGRNLSGTKLPNKDYSRYNFKGVLLKNVIFSPMARLPVSPETHSFKKEWLFTISFPFVSCTSGLEFRLPHLSRLLHSTFRTQLFR